MRICTVRSFLTCTLAALAVVGISSSLDIATEDNELVTDTDMPETPMPASIQPTDFTDPAESYSTSDSQGLSFRNMSVEDMPVDEWTFTKTLGKEEAKRQLEDHWNTPMPESTGSGSPYGYWAFNLTSEEPYVDGQIPYIERILGWAREIGLKVELDLHGAPGSQNGYDNSGRRGTPEWLLSRTNIDRTLDALTKMTSMVLDWDDVVYGIQILNEPSRWKWKRMIWCAVIAPNVYFMIHDTFLGPNDWGTLVSSNWTNTLMDTHIYQMFDNYMVTINETAHINMVAEMAQNVTKFDRGNTRVVVGEFSAATHDCTKYINGLGRGSRWEGTLEGVDHPLCPFKQCSCTGDYGSDYKEFSESYKAFLKGYVDAQLAIYDGELMGWFYWNFRTEEAPEWDYLLGVDQGWIPKFPRTAYPMVPAYVPEEDSEQNTREENGSANSAASVLGSLSRLHLEV
ncbi:glycoside hydrolase [Linderina pennispora]|uniref:glucan 1,3-beta-glucosidase n=1 Tax=Linderina pennispora TaxID=61395 RepID=A0A1Y1WJR2_9FUNG|nr:glycoside hydrolase [Linderina pennispora]ORX73344.1 glycoside hydrolase [Linderina pennispora]